MNEVTVGGSFRDPSGFLFSRDGELYRQVNATYRENYDLLMSSGLFQKLTESGHMVGHDEAPIGLKHTDDAYKVIKPEFIPFISYPYEWCFSQLKDAALLTLQIQKVALEHGMSLKDASNYNVQFFEGRPVFIDTLSFEKYREGKPWVGYRQFCEHFLSPLLLMKYVDPKIGIILRDYIDGIPIELAAKLLPVSTKFNFRLLVHIHLHARSKKHYAGKTIKSRQARFGKLALMGFIETLEGAVSKIRWEPGGTEWGDYYSDTNYSSEAQEKKTEILEYFIDTLKPAVLWDLGANDGTFSRLASDKGILTISFDIDPSSVEKNYTEMRRRGETHILPLVMDVTNPSPDLGWNNSERESLTSRGRCDTLMALALVHHLSISNNVPLPMVAEYMCGLCDSLIIEWVPKDDSQVQRLLATREDVFPCYTREFFEQAFSRHFEIVESRDIEGTRRSLYMMRSTQAVRAGQ